MSKLQCLQGRERSVSKPLTALISPAWSRDSTRSFM